MGKASYRISYQEQEEGRVETVEASSYSGALVLFKTRHPQAKRITIDQIEANIIDQLFVSDDGRTIGIRAEVNRFGESVQEWFYQATDQAIADFETYLSEQKELLDKLKTQKARREGE